MKFIPVVLLALTLAACAGTVGDPGEESPDARQSELRIGVRAGAAETVVTTPVASRLVMSFNESDPAHITYNNSSRQIFRQASQMGFVLLDVNTKQQLATSRLSPPNGWAVLWGDPAITRHRNDSKRIYLANIAVPSVKFPNAGKIEGSITDDPFDDDCGSYLGGACIARSTNGGNSFSLSAVDCVTRTTAACPWGEFYDGGDLDTDTAGRVYAAFFDVTMNRILVYMATSPDGQFALLPTPPSMLGHPRIKSGPGGLYVVGSVPNMFGTGLAITRYGGGSSYAGTWTTPQTITTSADVFSSMNGIRLGSDQQRDMDIGLNEAGVPEVRVVYTFIEANRLRVGVTSCTTGATITCNTWSTWHTTSAGHQFQPAIAAGVGARFWAISFYNTAGSASKVELWKGRVAFVGGSAVFDTLRQEPAQTPCSDGRGYWGDYDSMAADAGDGLFRGFTDSTTAPCVGSNFTSQPLNAALSTWNHFTSFP